MAAVVREQIPCLALCFLAYSHQFLCSFLSFLVFFFSETHFFSYFSSSPFFFDRPRTRKRLVISTASTRRYGVMSTHEPNRPAQAEPSESVFTEKAEGRGNRIL